MNVMALVPIIFVPIVFIIVVIGIVASVKNNKSINNEEFTGENSEFIDLIKNGLKGENSEFIDLIKNGLKVKNLLRKTINVNIVEVFIVVLNAQIAVQLEQNR